MINESFYKNVFLLMQVVPASYECTIHFKKGMFDKPNTTGFIHISHYLLSVHNAKRFKKMVTWPILNKMDEKRYRMEIREYFAILANENPDINFPSLLMSHLLQAGGKKILILMWKISEISLKAYISKTCQIELLQAPNIGDSKHIVQTYFTIKNIEKDNTISKFHENTKLSLKSFEQYMRCNAIELIKIQTAIFEVKSNIEKLISKLPVNSLIAKRLMDIDDTEIINSWKRSVAQNIKFLNQKYLKLKKLETFSSTLQNLISNLCVNCIFLDGRNLQKINSKTLLLYSSNNIQLGTGLYIKKCLVFKILLSIFDQMLKQIKYYLKVDKSSDILNCDKEIIQHCKTVKSLEESFEELMKQVSNNLYDVQHSLQKKTINYTLDEDILNFMGLDTILNSPELNLCTDYIWEEKIANQILISPIQGKYKYLFKRHKCNIPFERSTRYQVNDSLESVTPSWESPQKQLVYKTTSVNRLSVSPKYSRLFSTSDRKKNYLKNNNAASTPNRNITPKKSSIQIPNTQEINIDAAIKDIFDLSCKIADVVVSMSKS
ncbi:uncharacterized protein LOC117238660 [Bombus vosnesenskii]|uniref:Uncharacterized protein LOC117238660 n=1 Tax=Bombus vosnesenskii TaxID=207650 RepID=A0A6J3L1Y2_9HYME|nr:uncharacterized protein LOC117238660 [Bombus vosnesenskii]